MDTPIYGYGTTYGYNLLGFPDTADEIQKPAPSPNQNVETGNITPSNTRPTIPAVMFPQIPMFLQNFGKQIFISSQQLNPSRVFIAAQLNPETRPFTLSNQVPRQPVLVFQSPLQYSGLPDQL